MTEPRGVARVKSRLSHQENDRFQQKLVVFSFIRLMASFIASQFYCALHSVIRFASLLANKITLKLKVSITLSHSENITLPSGRITLKPTPEHQHQDSATKRLLSFFFIQTYKKDGYSRPKNRQAQKNHTPHKKHCNRL